MITFIIIALALLLVALLVDWQKVLDRYQRIPKKPPVQRRERREVQPPLRPAERIAETFDFDDEQPQPELPLVVQPMQPVQEQQVLPQYSKEVESLLAEADVHFRKGEMKAAEQFYLQAAAKDPRCSKAYSRLGVIYLEYGDNWEDAEAAFRQALKTEPTNGFILNNLGLVLYHQDKYADAIRQFEMAVRQDELNAARHANLGMAYMAMRQYAKAESAFKKALKLAPNELEYKDLLSESIEKKKAHKTMVRR